MLAACVAPPAGHVLVADEARFAVTLPDGWDSRATDPADWADRRTVALISSQPLDPQCAATTDAGSCTAPVDSLDEGALLMWWLTTTCAGRACQPPDGERLLVGGRQAARIEGTHLCDALGATHEEAYLVTVSPQRLDAIVVCERDVADAVRAQLPDILERVDWRTP
jgi:hypothetical protein